MRAYATPFEFDYLMGLWRVADIIAIETLSQTVLGLGAAVHLEDVLKRRESPIDLADLGFE